MIILGEFTYTFVTVHSYPTHPKYFESRYLPILETEKFLVYVVSILKP